MFVRDISLPPPIYIYRFDIWRFQEDKRISYVYIIDIIAEMRIREFHCKRLDRSDRPYGTFADAPFTETAIVRLCSFFHPAFVCETRLLKIATIRREPASGRYNTREPRAHRHHCRVLSRQLAPFPAMTRTVTSFQHKNTAYCYFVRV